jgi:hypothetical protein
MSIIESKTALNVVKNRINNTAEKISLLILIQLIVGLILIILLGLIYYLYFSGDISALVSNFIVIDIYSFIAGLGMIFFTASIGFKVLVSCTIIFSLIYFATIVAILLKISSLRKSFVLLRKEEQILTQATSIGRWFIVFLILSSISLFVPSIGWIILLIFANASLNVSFYNFHIILSRYGLKLPIHRNSAYLILAGSFVKIVFALLLFIDIAFLPGIVIGSLFYYFAFISLKNHVKYVAPVLKDTPPPPAIPAPSAPPPRPVVGKNGKIEIASVPSPPASEFDDEE